MSLQNFFLIPLTILIIVSCASGERVPVEVDESDLVEKFDLKDKRFDKFLTKPKEVELPIKKEILEKKVKQKKTPNEKTNSKKNKKSKKQKTIVEEITKVDETIVTKENIFPDDYPEDYKKFDSKYSQFWKNFKPTYFENEKMVIDAKFMGIYVGTLELITGPVVSIANKYAFSLKAILKSAKYYSYIYSLNDTLESFVEIENFLPIKFVLKQRESGQEVDDLQLFDWEQKKTFMWYKRVKNGKTKETEVSKYIPQYFQDSFSALYFVRGLPLKIGEMFEFPIVSRGKIWLLSASVDKVEDIQIMNNNIKAFKIKAETRFPGVLEKTGDIIFWYSADHYRKLLKFEAKVKLGTVSGELVKYESGKKI
ncbi:MAG: DUF3108 domain-containing protein [Halobacteriovoraceae bacterium]|nr:DUF3108 domain-containing protein [Halobacteriovoraceae bacterium]